MAHSRKGRAIQYAICPGCGGSGKAKLDSDPSKANPAFIPSTRPKDYDDDEVSQRIDYIIANQLRSTLQAILFWEFTRPGSQFEKAGKMRITHDAYRVRLHRAIAAVGDLLT